MIIELYFLTTVVNVQIFHLSAELAILPQTPTNEANAETETQPLIAETKARKCSK